MKKRSERGDFRCISVALLLGFPKTQFDLEFRCEFNFFAFCLCASVPPTIHSLRSLV